MERMKRIILASQSVQRKLLMEALGLSIEVLPANIDEKNIIEVDQKLRSQKIAKAKADFIKKTLVESGVKNNNHYIIIAADTYTVFNGKAYEKPENLNEARQMLREQSGQTGLCFSGFAYIDTTEKFEYSSVATTKLVFRDISKLEIQKYVNENPVLTWSAGFCPAYPAGVNLISEINGSLSSFTHGLPMEMLIPLLKKSGVFDEKI